MRWRYGNSACVRLITIPVLGPPVLSRYRTITVTTGDREITVSRLRQTDCDVVEGEQEDYRDYRPISALILSWKCSKLSYFSFGEQNYRFDLEIIIILWFFSTLSILSTPLIQNNKANPLWCHASRLCIFIRSPRCYDVNSDYFETSFKKKDPTKHLCHKSSFHSLQRGRSNQKTLFYPKKNFFLQFNVFILLAFWDLGCVLL